MDQNTASLDDTSLRAALTSALRANSDILIATLSEHLKRGESELSQQLRYLTNTGLPR